MVIIAGTGHRPNKLGGFSTSVHDRLVDLAIKVLPLYNTTQVISGMALGWDIALAKAAIKLGIPLVAAVPFKEQYKAWKNKRDIDTYFDVLEESTVVYVDRLWDTKYIVPGISPDVYDVLKMQRRNEYMVDEAEAVLALWDGSRGGTGNCVNYAESKKRRVINLWKTWVKYSGCF